MKYQRRGFLKKAGLAGAAGIAIGAKIPTSAAQNAAEMGTPVSDTTYGHLARLATARHWIRLPSIGRLTRRLRLAVAPFTYAREIILATRSI